MSHEDLVEKAKEAISAVFSDESVPQRTTLESLGDLQDEIGTLMDCINSDLKRSERE